MKFNSGSSIKNNAYSASSASVDTNEKLKKLNEELDQLELLVSGMQTSLSSVNSKVGVNSVSSQITAAKTEIENAIGQSVTTQQISASEADIDTIVSNILRADSITPKEGNSVIFSSDIEVPAVKLSDAIISVANNNDIKVPENAIAWIGSNLIINKGNGNALIFSETGDISYHFVDDNILINANDSVSVSYIYRDSPVEVVAHESASYTSVNSGLTVVGPFYADLTAASFQNITISNTLTAKDVTAENISVSEDVNVTGTVTADKIESNNADIEEIESDAITSDRINSSQIHTKIDKENIGYTTVQEHQDTEEYTIGIPITNGLWEIELEGYIKATIDKTNSAVLITYWRDSESALTRVGVKDGVFYFYTRKSGKLYFSNNTLEVNDTTISVNAPNDPGYPVPETLDKEINITANEGVIATETMVVDNLIVTGDLTIKDFVADKVAVRITDEDQDFNVAFTAPLPNPEEEEVSNNYIYGDSDLTYNPTTNTLGTGSIKVEKDIELVDSVDEETEEVTYSSGKAYQYLSVSCEADGETLRAHWEDAADTISCTNPKLTSSQTIAAYNGKTAENKYPITHLGTCTTLHGNNGDGYLCLEDARLYSPALYAGANTVCKLMVDGICNPKIYDRTIHRCHDVASWVCTAPATSTWNSVVCNNGLYQKLTTTDHVKAAFVTACDTVLACCHLESRGDLTVAGKTHISGDLYVDGTTHYVDTETSTIQDDTLVLRTNAQTGLGYDKVSGIVVNKYNGTDSISMVTDCTGTMRVGTGVGTDTCYPAICFNNDDKKWYVNDVETSVSGNLTSWATKTENDPYTEYTDAVFTAINLTSLEPVLTRAETSDLTDELPLVWDATNTKAITSDEAVVKYESTALPNEPVNKLYGITESVSITNMKLKELALKYFELSGNNYVPKANTLSTSVTIGSDTNVNITTISSDFTTVNGTITTTKSSLLTGTVNLKKFYIGETSNCKYYDVGSGDGSGSGVTIDAALSNCEYKLALTDGDDLFCSSPTYNTFNSTLTTNNSKVTCCAHFGSSSNYSEFGCSCALLRYPSICMCAWNGCVSSTVGGTRLCQQSNSFTISSGNLFNYSSSIGVFCGALPNSANTTIRAGSSTGSAFMCLHTGDFATHGEAILCTWGCNAEHTFLKAVCMKSEYNCFTLSAIDCCNNITEKVSLDVTNGLVFGCNKSYRDCRLTYCGCDYALVCEISAPSETSCLVESCYGHALKFEYSNELNYYPDGSTPRLLLNYRGGACCTLIGDGTGTGGLGTLCAWAVLATGHMCSCWFESTWNNGGSLGGANAVFRQDATLPVGDVWYPLLSQTVCNCGYQFQLGWYGCRPNKWIIRDSSGNGWEFDKSDGSFQSTVLCTHTICFY